MQHEGEGALPGLVLEDVGDILVGVTRMDDQRQAGFARRRDVAAKARRPAPRESALVVIVEPDLADRDATRMRAQAHEVGRRDVAVPRARGAGCVPTEHQTCAFCLGDGA